MVAVDDILEELINDQLAAIVADPNTLNDIFAGRTNTDRTERLRQFVLTKSIKVVKHHPRTSADWPCFAIVLEGSTESDQVIGESGDDYTEVPVSYMTDGWIGSDSTLISTLVVPPSDVKQSYSFDTQDGRRVCRMIAKKNTSEGKGIYINFENSVLNGGYISLTQMNNIVIRVKSNRAGSFLKFAFGENAHGEHEYTINITNKNVWERVTIDINDVPDEDKDTIKYMSFVITDDSADIDIRIDEIDGETSEAWIYNEVYLDHRYRIESWSNNADLTLDMHTMLLWWILKYRTWLQNSYGIIRQRVEGADIMYQPDYIPEFSYVRGLIFSSTTIEPIPREENLARMDVRVSKIDFY